MGDPGTPLERCDPAPPQPPMRAHQACWGLICSLLFGWASCGSAQEWEPVALQGGAQFRVNVTAIMRTVNDCSRHYAHDASLTLNVVDGAINQEASSGPASMTQIDPQFTTASFVVGSSASGTVDMFLAFYRHYSSGAYGNPESTEAVFRISGSGIAKIRDQHDDGCDSNPPTYATYFDVTPYGASATFVVTGKF